MSLFIMNNMSDVYKAINEFNSVKPELKYSRALAILQKLDEYDTIVKIDENNTILNYVYSDRFIIKHKNDVNDYKCYEDMLKIDLSEYNKSIYNDIYQKIDNKMTIQEVMNINKKYNDMADELIKYYYPELSDYCDTFEKAVYNIFLFFNKSIPKNILSSILDDIEYIIYSNVLSTYHINRRLLGLDIIKQKSLYNSVLDDDLKYRLDNLINQKYTERYDVIDSYLKDYSYFRNFDNKQLVDYLKIQKRNFEMDLVNSNICSDYKPVNYKYIDDNRLKEKYFEIMFKVQIPREEIIFKLEMMGFPIREKLEIKENKDKYLLHDVTIPIYYEAHTGERYLVLSSLEDSVNIVFFINNKNSYKVNLNTKNVDNVELNTLLESVMISINTRK